MTNTELQTETEDRKKQEKDAPAGSALRVKNRDIAVVGDVLAEGMDYLPSSGTFREQNKILAGQVGLVSLNGRLISIIPLAGRYVPKRGDTILGEVMAMTMGNWFVNIGYANEAALSVKEASSDFIERGADLSQYFDIGDIIMTQVINVTKAKNIDLTMRGPGLHKVRGGRLLFVTPSKVPRIIGKQGSMVSLIKDKTGCRITVGQNGWIWLQGDDPQKELLATRAIQKIEAEAHKSGLTETMQKFLEGSN